MDDPEMPPLEPVPSTGIQSFVLTMASLGEALSSMSTMDAADVDSFMQSLGSTPTLSSTKSAAISEADSMGYYQIENGGLRMMTLRDMVAEAISKALEKPCWRPWRLRGAAARYSNGMEDSREKKADERLDGFVVGIAHTLFSVAFVCGLGYGIRHG